MSDRESMRAWRMGPYRDRRERWDLVPVSCLGLAREVYGPLFQAGYFTAGRLAAAMTKRKPPAALKDPAIRALVHAALTETQALCEPDRLAIEAELAELFPAQRERSA